ncbi:MAG: hypothetical protein AB7U85_09235 [Alphaproteobacteria bacterium]
MSNTMQTGGNLKTALKNKQLLIVTLLYALAGCSFASNALFPSLGGNKEEAQQESMVIDSSTADKTDKPVYFDQNPPKMGSTDFKPLEVTQGSPTGTFVGKKVVTSRQELSQLQQTIRRRNAELQAIRNKAANDIAAYHETVAFINARLQMGTTPGNPKLTSKWQDAQRQLETINRNITMMNQLATQVASDSAMTSYLLDSIRAAYNISGAVEEDHEQLRILEDETNQTSILIERLLNELNEDIKRQQQYATSERNNQNVLALSIKDGQLYGSSFNMPTAAPVNNQKDIIMSSNGSISSVVPSATVNNRKPLMVIRFHRPNVAYEQPLYQTVKQTLERYPNASFDLVAVSPFGQQSISGAAARRYAESVLRSLTTMGLPANNVRLSAMESSDAQTSEVHLYLR